MQPDDAERLSEPQRLACLDRYDLADGNSNSGFDHLTALAASLLDMPCAVISLIDADGVMFLSQSGIALPDFPRRPGFFVFSATHDHLRIVEDATCDLDAMTQPFVTGGQALRFFAAAPLRTKEGFTLGTLCVLDRQPRSLVAAQRDILHKLTVIVMDELELRREARAALRAEREAQQRLWATEAQRLVLEADCRRQSALDAAQLGDWELDLKTSTTRRSLQHDKCFGYSTLLSEWTYATFLRHVHPEDRQRVDKTFQEAMVAGTFYDVEFRVIWPDGSLHWLLSRGRFTHDDDGQPIAVSGIQVDITDRKQAQAHIDRLALVVDKITTPVLTTDVSGHIDWVNAAFTEVTGFTANDALGKKPGALLQGPDTSEASVRTMRNAIGRGRAFEVDILNYRKNGAPFWQHIKADPIASTLPGTCAPYIAVQTDITQRKRLESELWTKANFDGLTDLPNRRLFWDRLHNHLHYAKRNGKKVALLFIDLDRFKEINDLHGHEHGDLVLLAIANRIRLCIRSSDTAARLSGDEFAVILDDVADCMQVELVVRKLLTVIGEPTTLQGVRYTPSASIGITLFPDDAVEPEKLFNFADQAMYMAKNLGRNRFSYFTTLMQQRAERRLRVGHDLRHALERHELILHFQPIVELSSGRMTKAEALLRWDHPVRGRIEPGEFIPLAEELGLIGRIGDWVFEQAAHWAHVWNQACPGTIQVSVNRSALQFAMQNGKPSWPELLHQWRISGRELSVEITEGALLKDSSAVMETLKQYRSAGIEVALDDFGTGYSSMAYLKKFSIDYLKIDQSFIQDIEAENSRTIAEAIIVMGQKLGLKIIAEGIETERQRAILAQAGCNYGQGYLFSPAVPPEVITQLLGASQHGIESPAVP
jgi:diguanylate cyclase (GGDEF)-like protein/PAS domain S-box-containing protein